MKRACAIVSAVAMGVAVQAASGQCSLVVRDSFRLGDRPHGGNGRLRAAQVHDTLKDYWPQVPSDGTMWMSNDQSGVANWAFAESSTDPGEVDPLDEFNGTAFGTAGAAALQAFAAPSQAFTLFADVVMLQGSTSATFLGYTSSPALLNNFQVSGTLWMSLNGRGEWGLYANGSQVIASGQAGLRGVFDSGWLRMELTWDPATSMVSGRVMGEVIAPRPVTLTRPLAFVGMEAFDSWNVVNNLSVFTGPGIEVSVPGTVNVCRGGTALLSASVNATGPVAAYWRRADGGFIADGPQSDGSVVSGSRTLTLSIAGVKQAEGGEYVCEVANDCGLAVSGAAMVRLCVADFNCAAGVGVQDIFDFLSAWFAGDIRADVNAVDGVSVQDIFDFLTAWFAGCA